MRHTPRVVLYAGTVCALVGASRATVGAQVPTVRDSAGVQIVENPSRLEAPVTFTLGATPVFEVGGLESDPDVEFNHRQGYLRGAFLSDGRFAAIDVNRVHYFDANGKRLKIVGRQGAGPQEFQYLMAICRTRGDTLVLNDANNRRMAVLDGTGSIVRTIAQGDLGSMPFDPCFDDGTFVLMKQSGPLTARQLRVTRVRLDGSVANVIGEFAGGLFDLVTQAEVSVVAQGKRLVLRESVDE